MKQSDYLKMLIHVAEGLATIHNFGIIHRDIKPENIICCNGIYKITDFGVISNETAAEDSVGSPLYWPPEVLFESTEYSQKFDIWSFGVVAFEVWFGMHPFYSPVPD